MRTKIRVLHGSAMDAAAIASESVDLIVTSPPYPMIEMWDETFIAPDASIGRNLAAGKGPAAFESMHCILDEAWRECDRVLRPGGLACVNIGDATRTLSGDFQLYSNHSRILKAFLDLGYAVLPDILWRKQTNAPTKFMGSGMLPVGAYVTYEHEYVLIMRKGRRRRFQDAGEKQRRRESAFFWEERNAWFSDVWFDIKGTPQALVTEADRKRSAAFPFELAYRLVSMFSIKGDHVLDPFAGTGTTLSAALTAGRNATGVELDASLVATCRDVLGATPGFANDYVRERLVRHMAFVRDRVGASGPMKYVNRHYGFPVMTAQERDLLIPDVLQTERATADELQVEHDEGPQRELAGLWENERWAEHPAATGKGPATGRCRTVPLPGAPAQQAFQFDTSAVRSATSR